MYGIEENRRIIDYTKYGYSSFVTLDRLDNMEHVMDLPSYLGDPQLSEMEDDADSDFEPSGSDDETVSVSDESTIEDSDCYEVTETQSEFSENEM